MNVHFVFWAQASLPEAFPDSPIGGAELAIFEIAKRLTDTYDVYLHCWGENNKEVEGVRIQRYKSNKITKSKYIVPDLFYYKIMRNIRQMGKNQIVHTLNCIEPFYHSPKSFTNILHLENDITDYLPYPTIKKRIYTSRQNKINYVIAVSHYIKKQYLEYFEYPKERVVVLLNGADTNRFTPNKRNRSLLREKYNIPEDDFVFLFSGRIIKRKGLHLAIKALANIAEIKDNVWLLVAGGSPKHFGIGAKTEKSIQIGERIASELIIEHPRIIYLGPVSMSEMPMYYASADTLLVPSIWNDPCPLTCAEGQASGIPVLGTARGGIPDSVVHEQTGLIGQPNVADIQKLMLRLINDSSFVKLTSKNARNRAMKYLDWDNITNSVRSLYEKSKTE